MEKGTGCMEAVEGAKFATDGARRRPERRLATISLKLLSDERLANLAAEGNKAAFATIYERHHQALYRYCRTITRNDEDARDALQATMLNAMKAIDTKPTKVSAWLYRIAHNESISILRAGKRHSTDSLDDVEPSAEAPLESRRELRELLDDIGHLSDRQRQALVMRELGGLSYEEVGAALDCSPAAAKQAAFDARTAPPRARRSARHRLRVDPQADLRRRPAHAARPRRPRPPAHLRPLPPLRRCPAAPARPSSPASSPSSPPPPPRRSCSPSSAAAPPRAPQLERRRSAVAPARPRSAAARRPPRPAARSAAGSR